MLDAQEKKKKYEPPAPPPRVGKKQKKRDAAGAAARLPNITPNAKCKLRLLKLERVKDYLLMEEEFVRTQELLKPHEERNEEDRTKVPGKRELHGVHFS
jgi:26S proteasome regulatory subunit T2